jgi:phosphoribosylamine--glycine ligase
VFGAGVDAAPDGTLTTAGGRVLTLVGRGPDVAGAADVVYAAAEHVTFAGKQLRRDIGRPQAMVAA